MKETNTSWIISTIRDNKAVHTFKAKLSSWLGLRKQPPVITEQSSLAEIGSHYPGMWGFLENKYHLRKSQLDTSFSLASVSKQFDLPPAQILFMEIQLEDISKRIQEITALEAQRLLQNDSRIEVLDVREPWERAFGSLPKSKPLDDALLKEMTKTWPKHTPVLIYCHFGVRSLDAAHHLSAQGFLQVFTITGGIDAWSAQVDSSIKRYSGSYC